MAQENMLFYRYNLMRIWGSSLRTILFIGLNPSTADETEDDPTIRRCIEFVKSWGFGGLAIVNLFAFISPHPSLMLKEQDPVGPVNNKHIKIHLGDTDQTVLIWGATKGVTSRVADVLEMVRDPWCIKHNKDGSPAHPLYLKKDLELIPYCGKAWVLGGCR